MGVGHKPHLPCPQTRNTWNFSESATGLPQESLRNHPRQISECFAHMQTYTETYMYIHTYAHNFVNNTIYQALLKMSNQKPQEKGAT